MVLLVQATCVLRCRIAVLCLACRTHKSNQSSLPIVMLTCQIAVFNNFYVYTVIATCTSSQTIFEHLQQMCQMRNHHTLLTISCHPVRHPFDACAAWQAIDLNDIDWRYTLFVLSALILLIGFVCLPGTSSGSSLLVPYIESVIVVFLLVFFFALLATRSMYLLPHSSCDIRSRSCIFRRRCCDESNDA